MKHYKKEQDGKLEAGLILYTKHFALTVDRALCKGCQICRLACPKEAITRVPQADLDGPDGSAVAVAPRMDVDEAKCDYCGICALACPFSAIAVTAKELNKDRVDNRVSADIFPVLVRDIKVDNARCKPGCKQCEEICPLGVLSVDTDKGEVAVKAELCAGCPACWMECPEDAIEVSKFIEGIIEIDEELCPEGCRRCVDVCPVNALELDEDDIVFAKEMVCMYCGACAEVCPQEGALRVERTAIRHTPVESGAWNKGLERLTSAEGLQREMAAANAAKARAALKNLETEVNA